LTDAITIKKFEFISKKIHEQIQKSKKISVLMPIHIVPRMPGFFNGWFTDSVNVIGQKPTGVHPFAVLTHGNLNIL